MAKRNAVYHAAHIIIQKRNDFSRRIICKPVFKSVTYSSKATYVAEKNRYVFQMRFKVNFFTGNCSGNPFIRKFCKKIQKFTFIFCTLIQNSNFIPAFCIKHADDRCFKISVFNFVCSFCKPAQMP